MKFFDFDHPFFRPLWRRIATVGVTASWGIFEFLMGNHFWGTLFVGIGALSFYGLFITFNPRDPEPKD
ncbi:MAG: DUF3329 domain-containing protein [Roseitalea sp.]|jgi:hypothetical protein|uniref:DUF3329 domain-containing protein n=1 Tax=Oceaniradius stylonematis TaxID=2184161 RepID=A0A3A8A6C9_9HYPH|nr:hypothetical protein [Oceaniradius stylonematis]MBO6552778.1 DUF3329 domain-containing protein [Roseitalea sp.]MBO6950301.1 DUF3329 domain-containing protein [Rhizobiaceae bacterium]RNC94745.1 MAG: DUF3329 domain-containing protein [Oricola sp.]MBO6591710.1 DUF3329 domain-containing protein [Roseitalea sp.]MBO6599565.1 DUF3329 domain-containing protein [Roseitalea sp.]